MARPYGSRSRGTLLLGLLVGAVVAVVVVSCGPASRPARRAPTSAQVPLPALDAALVTRGRAVFLANCASCHGVNAQGAPNWQKPDARGDLPPPPHDDTGHTWRHGDAELAGIIRHGLRDVFNKTPELTMPPFQDRLSDEEIAAVMTYFKSLWSPEHRRDQAEQNRRPPMPMATPGGGR